MYMCVSNINICCDGLQRLPAQWWHVHVCQQHQHLLRQTSTFARAVVACHTSEYERPLQQCRHVTICSTNAFCGGASMSCSGINAFCSGAITSTAPTFPTNTAAPGSQRIPHNDCNASRHHAETVAVLHATLLFACNISAVCSHVCTQQRFHTR